MGRTILSFRLLIDMDELEWKQFRNYHCRHDKKNFNNVLSISKLYCHSLSNLTNPIIILSIFMAILFYNEKIMYLILKDNVEEETPGNSRQKSFKDDENCQQQQQIIENWRKFTNCLNENDKNIFIKMIKECYLKYSKSICQIKKKNSIHV